LTGIGLALAAGLPRDALHILYGVLSVAALLGLIAVLAGPVVSHRPGVVVVTSLVLLLLVIRSFQTGSA
jgi:hypothetical protein